MTTEATSQTSTGPDYALIVRRFNAACADLLHREHSELTGDAFYAEAMRRAITGDTRTGVIPTVAAESLAGHELHVARRNATQYLDRAEKAEDELLRRRGEDAIARRYSAANLLRLVATHRMSKYRREGWEAAIEWLWPAAFPAPDDLTDEQRAGLGSRLAIEA